jgi:hypothetical protein
MAKMPNLEADALAAVKRDAAAGWTALKADLTGHHHQAAATATAGTAQEDRMTDTASEQGAPQDTTTFWPDLHHNITVFTGIMDRFLPHLGKIATDKKLDDAVEALLAAAGAGVPAEVFEFITNSLRAAAQARATPAAVTAESAAAPAPDTGAQPPPAPADKPAYDPRGPKSTTDQPSA